MEKFRVLVEVEENKKVRSRALKHIFVLWCSTTFDTVEQSLEGLRKWDITVQTEQKRQFEK
jgi:hypothetical protein